MPSAGRNRFLLVALLGIAAALLAVTFWRIGWNVDQLAIAKVEECGGRIEVAYDLSYEFTSGKKTVAVGAGSPPTLVLGIFAWGDEVSFFDLSSCPVSDGDAALISRSSDCAILSLRDCNLTNIGLHKLLTMQSLQILDLRGVSIDEEAVSRMQRLGNLRGIILDKSTNLKLAERIRTMTSFSQCEVYVD